VVVEKETQQLQIGGANLAAQEEIVAQPAVEVLDQRAGAVEAVAELRERLLEWEEAVLELPMQGVGVSSQNLMVMKLQ
jgi:hypothetical protein